MTSSGSTSSGVPTDADLVAGVLAGDRSAFAGVYEKYADRLYDFAFSMLRSREEASDCVADSFVLMAEKLGQLRDPSALRPWLYSVVRNECLRTLRGRARLAHDDEWLEAMPDQDAGPEQQVETEAAQEEMRELVWAAIEGLNDRDRSLLDLHLRQGLEGAELAAAMDVTPANAYVMLSRARDQVERSLGALLIARRGSEACAELSALLRDWDGRFSPLIRKRVARHIDGCEVCETSRKLLVSPLALLSAVPAFAAPAALKDRVLDDPRLVAFYVDGATTPVPALAPAPAPAPGDEDRSGRRAALLAGVAVLLLLLGVGAALVLWPDGDEGLVAIDSPTSAATSSDPAPAPTSTAVAPTTATPSGPSETASEPSSTATSEATVAAPARLTLSTRTLDLGSRASSGTVRLGNSGGTALDFTASPRRSWLSVSRASGEIAPDGSVALTITANRAALAEGRHSAQVAVSWSGGTELVTVRINVNRPPRIGTITAGATSCSVPVSANVVDGTGVRSVRVSWSGSVSGSAAATRSGDRWKATIPVTVGGSVKVTFTATDSAGLRTTRSRTFTFDPCSG